MPQTGANNSVPCGEQVVMGEQTQAVVLSRSTEAMEGLRQKGDQEREGVNRTIKFTMVLLFSAWEVPSQWLLELFNIALCVIKKKKFQGSKTRPIT